MIKKRKIQGWKVMNKADSLVLAFGKQELLLGE